jgi:hypothetical protein
LGSGVKLYKVLEEETKTTRLMEGFRAATSKTLTAAFTTQGMTAFGSPEKVISEAWGKNDGS